MKVWCLQHQQTEPPILELASVFTCTINGRKYLTFYSIVTCLRPAASLGDVV